MLKIKDDVPLINLIDLGFKCEPCNVLVNYLGHRERYIRKYNNIEINIMSDDREIRCQDMTCLCHFYSPKMYDHCIRDLVQKGYVENVKN